MKKITGLFCLALAGASVLGSLPAKADTYFNDSDRVVLRNYYTTKTTTTTTSTPGSRTVTTYYTPGTVLPETVTYSALPTTITTKLRPAPQGDEYTIIDGNAYLIDPGKRVVIDSEKLND